MTVRFKHKVVNLRRVKVVENSVYDLILGAEWIAKCDIVICAAAGRLVAQVQNDAIDVALLGPHQPGKKVVTGVKMVRNTPVDARHTSAGRAGANGRAPSLGWPSHTLCRPSRGQKQEMSTIAGEPSKLQCLESPLDFLGAVTVDKAPPTSQWTSAFKGKVALPGRSRFVPVRRPPKRSDKLVNRSSSARSARKCMKPTRLRVRRGKSYIPLINLGRQLRWDKGRRPTKGELLDGRNESWRSFRVLNPKRRNPVAKRSRRTWRRFNVHVAQMRLFHVRSDFDWRPENDGGPLEDEYTDTPVADEMPEQSTNVPHDDDESDTQVPVSTRLGRAIRRPNRLCDFVSMIR